MASNFALNNEHNTFESATPQVNSQDKVAIGYFVLDHKWRQISEIMVAELRRSARM